MIDAKALVIGYCPDRRKPSSSRAVGVLIVVPMDGGFHFAAFVSHDFKQGDINRASLQMLDDLPNMLKRMTEDLIEWGSQDLKSLLRDIRSSLKGSLYLVGEEDVKVQIQVKAPLGVKEHAEFFKRATDTALGYLNPKPGNMSLPMSHQQHMNLNSWVLDQPTVALR